MVNLGQDDVYQILIEVWPQYKPLLPPEEFSRVERSIVKYIQNWSDKSLILNNLERKKALLEDRNQFQYDYLHSIDKLGPIASYKSVKLSADQQKHFIQQFESLCTVRAIDLMMDDPSTKDLSKEGSGDIGKEMKSLGIFKDEDSFAGFMQELHDERIIDSAGKLLKNKVRKLAMIYCKYHLQIDQDIRLSKPKCNEKLGQYFRYQCSNQNFNAGYNKGLKKST